MGDGPGGPTVEGLGTGTALVDKGPELGRSPGGPSGEGLGSSVEPGLEQRPQDFGAALDAVNADPSYLAGLGSNPEAAAVAEAERIVNATYPTEAQAEAGQRGGPYPLAEQAQSDREISAASQEMDDMMREAASNGANGSRLEAAPTSVPEAAVPIPDSPVAAAAEAPENSRRRDDERAAIDASIEDGADDEEATTTTEKPEPGAAPPIEPPSGGNKPPAPPAPDGSQPGDAEPDPFEAQAQQLAAAESEAAALNQTSPELGGVDPFKDKIESDRQKAQDAAIQKLKDGGPLSKYEQARVESRIKDLEGEENPTPEQQAEISDLKSRLPESYPPRSVGPENKLSTDDLSEIAAAGGDGTMQNAETGEPELPPEPKAPETLDDNQKRITELEALDKEGKLKGELLQEYKDRRRKAKDYADLEKLKNTPISELSDEEIDRRDELIKQLESPAEEADTEADEQKKLEDEFNKVIEKLMGNEELTPEDIDTLRAVDIASARVGQGLTAEQATEEAKKFIAGMKDKKYPELAVQRQVREKLRALQAMEVQIINMPNRIEQLANRRSELTEEIKSMESGLGDPSKNNDQARERLAVSQKKQELNYTLAGIVNARDDIRRLDDKYKETNDFVNKKLGLNNRGLFGTMWSKLTSIMRSAERNAQRELDASLKIYG